MTTHGDELSSGTLLHIRPPGILPHSLAKLIARDTAMSTLDALANHLIKENDEVGMQVWHSGLSTKFICKS
jgi:hypothetical protein